MELQTYVIYDIKDDRIRSRISEICKDYGLERIQYSAFLGLLSRNKREELFLKLSETIGDNTGKIMVQPICEKDARDQMVVLNEKDNEDETEEKE